MRVRIVSTPMSRTFVATISLLSVLVVTAAGEARLPRPWSQSLFDRSPYRVGVDPSVVYDSQPSLFINAGFSPQTQVGPGVYTVKFSVASGVRQAIKADRYRGRRMRWSGSLRTENVGSVWNNDPPAVTQVAASRDSSPGAGLYVISDSREDTVLYAMTRVRLLGTNDWRKVELVFDVPAPSVLITVGFFLAGKGNLWAAGFGFEEVAPTTELTFALDLTRAEQTYQDRFARHKKRLKEYARSPDAPVLHISGR
jgi:hypothetical protein